MALNLRMQALCHGGLRREPLGARLLQQQARHLQPASEMRLLQSSNSASPTQLFWLSKRQQLQVTLAILSHCML
jgi:hypothetical protein